MRYYGVKSPLNRWSLVKQLATVRRYAHVHLARAVLSMVCADGSAVAMLADMATFFRFSSGT